jgi:hypothetical protein
MRPAIAALVTIVVPTLIGRRWIDGPAPLRWGAGGLLGFVFLGWGAMVGGLLGGVLPGAIVVLAVAWALGPRYRLRLSHAQGSPRLATGVVTAIGVVLVCMAFWRPVPAWDAWAIWSMDAKALAQYDSFDNPAFIAPEYSRRFYPPLLPAWQATAFQLSGDYTRSFPTQVQMAWLWTAGALALVGLGWRRRSPFGLVLVVWAVSPVVLLQVMKGYADVPAAMFAVAGAGLLFASREERAGIAPGAILLGGAAATKAEAAIMALVVIGALALWDRRRREALTGLAIVIAAVLPWVVFATAHGLSGYLFRDRVQETVLGRVPVIARSMLGEVFDPDAWGVLLPAIIIILVLSRPTAMSTTAGLGGLAAIFLVYLMTPFSVEWLLSHSVTRVMIGPVGLLALAAAMAEPRGRLGASPSPPRADRATAAPD